MLGVMMPNQLQWPSVLRILFARTQTTRSRTRRLGP